MKLINEVLLIDDDNINNHLNRLLIRDLKITDRITSVSNGIDALDYLTAHRDDCPRLIFLDINMPAMDGFEFLQDLSKMDIPHRDEMVIVMLSTSRNPRDIQTLQQLGYYDYITKPLTAQKLHPILEKYFV